MNVFVNEHSIDMQHHEQAAFDISLRKFRRTLELLLEQKSELQTYQKAGWVNVYQAVKDKPFLASLNLVKNKELKRAFTQVLFNRLNAKDWQQEQLHSSDDFYMYGDEVVTDTSMAEAAERSIQNIDTLHLLINFPESKFAGLSAVRIIKNEKDETNIDCVEQYAQLEQWLESKFQLSRYKYDKNSDKPPTDEQTLLVNEDRFKKTSLRVQGRSVYYETSTGLYWYVDNLHFGLAAHIEVFDTTGNHYGEANLIGEIDLSKQDKDKKLDR